MSKKIIVACVAAVCVIVLIGVSVGDSAEKVPESEQQTVTQERTTVMIAVLSSRPGCEQTDSCYLPPRVTIDAGQTVTWVNDDRAFHTVTGGYYDVFDGTFNSGHMNPSDKFAHTFDDSGEFHYYCKLHPWMEGTVVVN